MAFGLKFTSIDQVLELVLLEFLVEPTGVELSTPNKKLLPRINKNGPSWDGEAILFILRYNDPPGLRSGAVSFARQFYACFIRPQQE